MNSLLYFEAADRYPTWLVALVVFIPLVGGLGLFFYKTRHARLWRKGIYPPKLKLTEDNLLEAYLSLGSLLILIDYSSSKEKTQFINGYFNQYFKDSNYNFGDSLLFSMRHPMKIESVCTWLLNNLKTEGERAQVIYFLTGLATLDGKLSDRERQFLQSISDQLKLDKEHLLRIIGIYSSYRRSKQETETKSRPSRSEATKYAIILGVSENPSKEELKKAYRKLAKEHHPDRFESASKAQQRMAEDKFKEITVAYDYWKSRLD